MERETFRTTWGQRAVGALVLGGVGAASAGLAVTGGAPGVTWAVLGVFGVASGVATVANFGDRFVFDDDGVAHENVVLRAVRAPRRVAWSDVLEAVDHEGTTWFLGVRDGRRLILDRVEGHDRIRLLLEEKGVPISRRERPRLFGRGATDPR